MPRTITLREEVADDGFLRQGRQRNGRYKLLAGRRDNNLHLGTSLNQSTNNQASFIRSNRACYTQNDFFSFKHGNTIEKKRGRTPFNKLFLCFTKADAR